VTLWRACSEDACPSRSRAIELPNAMAITLIVVLRRLAMTIAGRRRRAHVAMDIARRPPSSRP